MNQQKHKTTSLKQFNDVVNNFMKNINKGDVILLNGDLGVGKTTFVKQAAICLSISKTIKSPTYSILKEYNNLLCHIDAYRISDYDLEIDNYVDEGYVIFIEWSNNILNQIHKIDYEIDINYDGDIEKRVITIKEY